MLVTLKEAIQATKYNRGHIMWLVYQLKIKAEKKQDGYYVSLPDLMERKNKYKTAKNLESEQKEKIIYLFTKTTDNTTFKISDKTGISLGIVNRIINEFLATKKYEN